MTLVEAVPAAPARAGRAQAVLAFRVRQTRTGQRTLRDVRFEVRVGEAYGLLGPPGAGKTTVVRLACGLAAPDDGEVLVLGRPVALLAPAVRHAALGYAPEWAAVMPGRSVADTVGFWARLSGVPSPGARVAEALAVAGLEELASADAERCPLGAQRRLGLAVAVLHRPRLVVLDEPLAGLDARGVERLLAALGRLRRQGTSLLCTSTRRAELAWLCDRAGVLDDGRLRDAC